MEIDKLTTSDWLKVGGGAVFFLAGFLAWWSFEVFELSESSNAFDYFFTGIVPWLIFSAIAVLSFLLATGKYALPDTVPGPQVFLGASVAGLLLVVVRFFSDGVDGDIEEAGIDVSRGIGLYLALLAAIAVVAGAAMSLKETNAAASPPPPPSA